MKKAVIAFFILLIIAIAGGAFYYVYGREYVFKFSEAQIQEKLNAKMPITKTWLFIFQVTLDNPRVNLVDGSGRIRAGLDLILNIQVGGEQRPLGGTLDVSGGVRYVPESGEFFLADPVIERRAVQGIAPRYTDKVNTVLGKALAEYYATHPIYSLRATNAKHVAARLVLKNVKVENRELVVTLGM